MPRTNTLQCNLCWEELKAPFIVTSCKHAFCDKHRNDPKLQARTCPGCSAHLDKVRHASYTVPKAELSVLNGLTPDSIFKITETALGFWDEQQQNKLDYASDRLRKAKNQLTSLNAQSEKILGDLQQQLQIQSEQKEQSLANLEEANHEIAVLKAKYQEEARTRHMLQETVVSMKRRRADSATISSPPRARTPTHATSPTCADRHGMSPSCARFGDGLGLERGGASKRGHSNILGGGLGSGRSSPIRQPRSPFIGAGASSRLPTPDGRTTSSAHSSRFGGFNLGSGTPLRGSSSTSRYSSSGKGGLFGK